MGKLIDVAYMALFFSFQVLDFTRECVVPAWVDSDSLRSYLTPAGKLTIEIPMEKTVRSELHFNVNQ